MTQTNRQSNKSEPVLVTSTNAAELRPELMAAMGAFIKVLKANPMIPDRLCELMRLRIAFRNQCRPCMSMRYGTAIDDGLTEDLICSLESPDEPSDLTPAERAAVNFGDKFASNHLSITVADRLALTEHFSPEQITQLAMLAAFFTGFGRFGAVFDTGDSYPVGERQEGVRLTPWGIHEPIVVRPANG